MPISCNARFPLGFLIAALAAVFVALGVAGPRVAGAQQPPAVSTQSAQSYQLSISGTQNRITVPLALAAQVNVDTLTFKVEGLRKGENLTSGLEPFFPAQPTLDKALPGFVLVVLTQAGDLILRPGTYQADVRATWTESPEMKAGMTLLPVKVTVSAASLIANGSITVTRTTECLPLITSCWTSDEDQSELTVDETSNLAPVRQLQADNRDVTGPNRPPGDVKINVGAVPEIAAGERGRSVPYGTEGDFAAGSTKGKLRLTSPSLDKDLVIDWTVRNRRGPLTYAVLILAGAGLGVLVRKGLTAIVELGERRDRVADLLIQLREERGSRPDQAFQKAVGEAITKVEAEVKKARYGDGAKIDTIVTDAQKALKAAVESLATARAQAAADLQTFRQELQLTGSFSEILSKPMASALANTAPIEDLINEFDATKAQERLRTERQVARRMLSETAAAWRVRLETWLQRLERPDHPMPSGTKRDLAEVLSQLREQLRAEGFVEPASVVAGQQAVGAAVRTVEELLMFNLAQLRLEAVSISNDLRARQQPAPEALGDAITALGRALEAEGEVASRLEAATQAASALLASLASTFQELAGNAADPETYGAAVREGLYRDAARMLGAEVVKPTEAPAPEEDDALRSLGPVWNRARGYKVAVTGATVTPLVVKPDIWVGAAEILAAPSGTITLLARFLRWAIMAMIAVIVGVVALPETIDGTRLQLLGVFLWAFTLDAAYAGLLAQVTKFATGPKAPG